MNSRYTSEGKRESVTPSLGPPTGQAQSGQPNDNSQEPAMKSKRYTSPKNFCKQSYRSTASSMRQTESAKMTGQMSLNSMPLPDCSRTSDACGNVARLSDVQKDTNVMTTKKSPIWLFQVFTTFLQSCSRFNFETFLLRELYSSSRGRGWFSFVTFFVWFVPLREVYAD